MRPPWTRGVAALVGTVLLAGCVSLPDSSSVHEGRAPRAQQDDPQVISNAPVGPTPGASREQVVAGFLAAMLAYPQTATVARQFLTPAASATWSPGARVVVYEDQEIVQRGRAITVATKPLGSLDERGSWTSATPGNATVTTRLQLARVDGEWRITNPMSGTFVDRDYFERSYDPYSLYFFDPAGRVLTPDPVWLLVGETTATALVKNLLLGPTADLAGVAETAAPPDTDVDVSVVISGAGLAEVPLNETVRNLSAGDLKLFAAQLAWTLRQVLEITAVTITVDGGPVDIPDVGTIFDVDSFGGFDPAGLAASRQLFALSSQGLVTVTGEGAVPVAGPISAGPDDPSSAGIDPTGSLAALVTSDGTSVVVGGVPAGSIEQPRVWFSGAHDLLRPSWDVHQVLWLIDRTERGAVISTVTRDGVRGLRAPRLEGQDIIAFAVSRDGVRLAAVVADGERTRLVMAMIDRDPEDPAKVSLRQVHPVVSPEAALQALSGLAWASPTSVVVLANDVGGDREPFEISIDGSAVRSTTGFLPTRPVSVAAGPNVDAPIVVGSASGRIYIQSADLQWTQFGGTDKLRSPVYPG